VRLVLIENQHLLTADLRSGFAYLRIDLKQVAIQFQKKGLQIQGLKVLIACQPMGGKSELAL